MRYFPCCIQTALACACVSACSADTATDEHVTFQSAAQGAYKNPFVRYIMEHRDGPLREQFLDFARQIRPDAASFSYDERNYQVPSVGPISGSAAGQLAVKIRGGAFDAKSPGEKFAQLIQRTFRALDNRTQTFSTVLTLETAEFAGALLARAYQAEEVIIRPHRGKPLFLRAGEHKQVSGPLLGEVKIVVALGEKYGVIQTTLPIEEVIRKVQSTDFASFQGDANAGVVVGLPAAEVLGKTLLVVQGKAEPKRVALATEDADIGTMSILRRVTPTGDVLAGEGYTQPRRAFPADDAMDQRRSHFDSHGFVTILDRGLLQRFRARNPDVMGEVEIIIMQDKRVANIATLRRRPSGARRPEFIYVITTPGMRVAAIQSNADYVYVRDLNPKTLR